MRVPVLVPALYRMSEPMTCRPIEIVMPMLRGRWLCRVAVQAMFLLAPILLAPVPGRAQQPPPKKPPPVVQPQGQTHAQKPAPAPVAAPAMPEPPVVPAVAAPVAHPPPVKPADGEKAEPSKLPRFQSLRSNEVNLRAGPGTRYRIDWVYKRADLPVEVVREFDHWRAIRDADGIEGWVNQATLNSRRSFVVKGGDATLRDDANDKSSAVATLRPGVIGRIRSCPKDSAWCHVTVAGHGGYLKRAQFWGTLPNEEILP
ncbi:MAG: SH3 domain-containing protein [Rhodospirillales bacterium]